MQQIAHWIPADTSYLRRVATWEVTIIRKKGQHLGIIDAPDECAAVTRVIEYFKVPPALQYKLALTKIRKSQKRRPTSSDSDDDRG